MNIFGHSHDHYLILLNFSPTFPSKDKEKEPSPVTMRPSRKGQDGLRAVGQNKVQTVLLRVVSAAPGRFVINRLIVHVVGLVSPSKKASKAVDRCRLMEELYVETR